MQSLAEKLMEAEPEYRAGIVAFPESGERDVLRQLARLPLSDGDLCSKGARDALVMKGLVDRYQGLNFLTQSGYAVVDALWGLEQARRHLERLARLS